ncbi:MAG: spore coat associated protein CotJA, partial [Oscillospiraceae bacterium]|nr:spore coat associated protein CotJA [Oscillospiraceae bacterium]
METGLLPAEGKLAVGYVPYQKPNSPRYTKEDALKNGTLYPGLNLPYR